MIRLLPWSILACFHFVVLPLSAQDDNKWLRPFQKDVLRISARQTQGSFEGGTPYFGKGNAFVASGYRKDGSVYFNLVPNAQSYAGVEGGAGSVKFPENRWLSQRLLEAIIQYSGPVAKGDFIPLFGCLYEVTGFSEEGNGGFGTGIELRKMDAIEWPDGIKLDPFAYAVLNGGHLDLRSSVPKVDIRDLSFDEKKNQFHVTVFQEYIKPARDALSREVAWTEKVVTIKSGMLLVMTVGGRRVHFRVVSVVPPDKDKHIPGWVEFRQLWPTVRPFGVQETLKIR
ncbi:MAG: hypothetical protein H8E37_09005 [Planctomycetes bacterium]|nr:hypothetical protein [Planctomycetota bacterium]